MSKRTFDLIVIISGAVSAVAIGLVSYFKVPNMTAINSSIELIESAVIGVCGNFIDPTKTAKKK
jgi:hypothetical protein